jgi:hypothetical protein
MGNDPIRPSRGNGRRWNVMWPATLVIEGRTYPCTILDLSHSGARLGGYGQGGARAAVQLQCGQFGSLGATLQWVRGGGAGVRFDKSPAEITDILRKVVPGMGRQVATTRLPRTAFGRLRQPVAAWR